MDFKENIFPKISKNCQNFQKISKKFKKISKISKKISKNFKIRKMNKNHDFPIWGMIKAYIKHSIFEFWRNNDIIWVLYTKKLKKVVFLKFWRKYEFSRENFFEIWRTNIFFMARVNGLARKSRLNLTNNFYYGWKKVTERWLKSQLPWSTLR